MRKILKKLHLYFALALCLPLVLQGLAGSILVFRNQISDVILSYKYDFADGEIASKEAIIEAAKQSASEGLEALPIKIPAEKKSAVKVRFVKIGEKKPSLEIVLDPVSLRVLEVNDPAKNFFRLIKKFHADLFIPWEVGKNLVGIFGIVMLFMCVSGVVIWYPKHGDFKRALTFKFRSIGKKFLRDLHGAVGFWTMIPLAISSVTGIYLIYFRSKESNKIWHALHEGAIGGMAWQLTVFLVGFLPLLFAITGILLWLKKGKKGR